MMDRSQPDAASRRIAFFISPHGFGHAARAASVMEALVEINSAYHFDISPPRRPAEKLIIRRARSG